MLAPAKRQVKLISEDENIIIDIYTDPGEDAGVQELIDEILCPLELDDDYSDSSSAHHEANILKDYQQGDTNNINTNQSGGWTGSDAFLNQFSLFQVDDDIHQTKDHNQLPETNKLTEMLYPAKEELINFVGRQ